MSDPPAPEEYVLRVNGVDHPVADAWLGENLLYVLRERLGLRAAKGACEQGECGSCSVLVDDRLVCSCLVLAATAVGRAVTTVEGLGATGRTTDQTTDHTADRGASGDLTDVQQAYLEAGAVQCGFCTPGLIVATHDLLDRVAEPTEMQIREELAGNVCRCTGYGRIIDAVQRVAAARAPGADEEDRE